MGSNSAVCNAQTELLNACCQKSDVRHYDELDAGDFALRTEFGCSNGYLCEMYQFLIQQQEPDQIF